MQGLMPASAPTLAGLEPSHFVAMASPHLGCDGGSSPAQVPHVVIERRTCLHSGMLSRGASGIVLRPCELYWHHRRCR